MKSKKGLLILASMSALSACGGGGGGDGVTSPNTGDIVSIPATTPGSQTSSGYDTKDLSYSINIVYDNNFNTVTGTATIAAYNSTGRIKGLLVSDTDKISAHADGSALMLEDNWNDIMGNHYTFPISRTANIYEFTFARGDVTVAEGSIDSLPDYIFANGVANGNDIHIEITESANHIYSYNAEMLQCRVAGEYSYDIIKHNVFIDEDTTRLNSDYRNSIINMFGYNFSELQNDYESCKVSVLLLARSEAINVTESHRNIGIHAFSTHMVEVPLF
ncbi:hypothetical protein G5S52_18445 [Grimontia sp. S25]|uniref:Lipoprotein n=1 Tax=Grimontia sedimenti TaxID=2711294 RepID=A0A6M1RBH4_9GAMM|nr:hypothetical protein [Grimontia sedimenti]NGN99553.1 hypothetical protein [Grimontia sedimenti]